jgi:hypothetical protein
MARPYGAGNAIANWCGRCTIPRARACPACPAKNLGIAYRHGERRHRFPARLGRRPFAHYIIRGEFHLRPSQPSQRFRAQLGGWLGFIERRFHAQSVGHSGFHAGPGEECQIRPFLPRILAPARGATSHIRR